MSNILPFSKDGFAVRAVEIDCEPWFVGKDVCDALGYANPADAISKHCKGVAKRYPLQTAGGMQDARVLNEPDVLRLIVSSRLPSAEKFERWVFEDVLPSIRKAGGYQLAPKSAAEVALASAQALVDLEHRLIESQKVQAQQQQDVARIETKVAELAESRVWDHCPQNCEPITRIRERINKQYGLPAWVVDMVMRGLPLSPKHSGMVRNTHVEAAGSLYQVWAISDVTRTFARFLRECSPATNCTATHSDLDRPFKWIPPALPPSALIRRPRTQLATNH